MWKRLSSSRINKSQWDACVQGDSAGLVYALSWYLDAVAPGWEGWVKEENEQYAAVIPVVKRRFAGFSVVTQPLLTQQFGLFTSNQSLISADEWQDLFFVIFKPDEAIEQYSFKPADYQVISLFLPVKEKTNLILPLTPDYIALKTAYRSNRTRDLQKAASTNLQLQNGNEYWPEAFKLYRENILPRLKNKQQGIFLKVIPRLVEAVIKQGLARTYLVSLPSGQVVAGAFFIQYKNRLTYLLPAASETGKKVGASTYLLDQVCQQFAGSNIIIDFEGSSQPGLARFYASLGAQTELYGLLENYNISLPLKLLYSLKNWLKKFSLPK